jgi:iron complex outermembrane recepter protein
MRAPVFAAVRARAVYSRGTIPTMRNSTGFLHATCLSALTVVATFAFNPLAMAQDDQPVGLLDEIVVTAQKRTEALADIPMSVSVLSGDLLARQQADNFQDLVALAPGFNITGSQQGFNRVTLRGINTGGVSSTVGIYVDEVPFGSSTGLVNGAVLAGELDTFDLARIELLRGPQGTLYGASSLGGVLKYVPNNASTEGFEGRIQGSVEDVKGADMGYALTGMVNVPIGDKFALRASGFSRSDEGFIDSIGNNPIPSLTDPNVNVIEGTRVEKGLNTTDTVGGRVSALFKPSEKFSLNLTALMQNIDSGAPDAVDADAVTLRPLNSSPVQSRYQKSYSNIEYRVYSATLDWDLGGVSLQSITSTGSLTQYWQQDLALGTALTGGLPLSAFLTFLFDDPNTPEIAPLLSAILPQETGTDKVTQELRLLSAGSDSFEWLVGAYYTDEDSLLDQSIFAVDAGTENPTAGFPTLAVATLKSTYEELAFFANATWYVSPRFDLSFGVRTSKNDQTLRQITSGPLAGDSDFGGKSSERPFTWSFSPRWELNDHSSIYVRAATGFRPGGPNIVPPGAPPEFPPSYDSDSITSYEAGYKSMTADGRYSVDLAVFYLDWQDIQILSSIGGFGVNANGGSATSKGVEFQASIMPKNGLSIALNAAYTDAYLTEDVPDLGAFDGDPLSYVPNWSVGLSTDYEWQVSGNSVAYVGGTLGYTGDRPAGLNNRDAGGDIREIDSYVLLNLRAGLQRERWSVELYGKNLTDEMGINSISSADEGYTGRVGLGYIRPRTYGLMLGVKF